jgi:hypothetical protein
MEKEGFRMNNQASMMPPVQWLRVCLIVGQFQRRITRFPNEYVTEIIVGTRLYQRIICDILLLTCPPEEDRYQNNSTVTKNSQ